MIRSHNLIAVQELHHFPRLIRMLRRGIDAEVRTAEPELLLTFHLAVHRGELSAVPVCIRRELAGIYARLRMADGDIHRDISGCELRAQRVDIQRFTARERNAGGEHFLERLQDGLIAGEVISTGFVVKPTAGAAAAHHDHVDGTRHGARRGFEVTRNAVNPFTAKLFCNELCVRHQLIQRLRRPVYAYTVKDVLVIEQARGRSRVRQRIDAVPQRVDAFHKSAFAKTRSVFVIHVRGKVQKLPLLLDDDLDRVRTCKLVHIRRCVCAERQIQHLAVIVGIYLEINVDIFVVGRIELLYERRHICLIVTVCGPVGNRDFPFRSCRRGTGCRSAPGCRPGRAAGASSARAKRKHHNTCNNCRKDTFCLFHVSSSFG